PDARRDRRRSVCPDRPLVDPRHDPALPLAQTGPPCRRRGTSTCGRVVFGRHRNDAPRRLGRGSFPGGVAVRYVKPISPRALSRPPGAGAVLSRPELSDLFKVALRALKAEPHEAATRAMTPVLLESILKGHGANRVVVANLPRELRDLVAVALTALSIAFVEDLPAEDALAACAAADVGITWAEHARAEGGES